MDCTFFSRLQQIYENVAGFGEPLPPVLMEGEQSLTISPPKRWKTYMKRLTTITLMVNLAVASAYAHHPVAMGFSGTSGASPINLNQPGTHTVEENVAGNGTLGSSENNLLC
jgi:hypothetical protein